MKTKPYTDYAQSMRLAKFLHTKTADMYWLSEYGEPLRAHLDFGNLPTGKGNYWPCWSLDALMETLPEVVTVFDEETPEDEGGERDYTDYKLNILKENEEWIIFYEEDAHSALDHDWPIDERGEHLIDAAYNAIVELNKKGLL